MLRPGAYRVETITLGAAVTGVVYGLEELLAGANYIAASVEFNRTSGGATCDVRLQTSLNKGRTWRDIMHFGFTTTSGTKDKAIYAKSQTSDLTPSDGSLGSNQVVEILGDRYRWKLTTTGTYVATLDLSFVVA